VNTPNSLEASQSAGMTPKRCKCLYVRKLGGGGENPLLARRSEDLAKMQQKEGVLKTPSSTAILQYETKFLYIVLKIFCRKNTSFF
jgi:hypothetical protein